MVEISPMIIGDLEKHIGQGDQHLIFTGTFDPPHIEHARTVRAAVQQMPSWESIVLVPHSWNKRKVPVDISKRTQWLTETALKFLPDLASRIGVCNDESVNNCPERFDELCDIYRARISRVVGKDKMTQKLRDRNQAQVIHILKDNETGLRSTDIREAIRRGQIDKIRALLAKSVLEDILESGCYMA